MARTLTDELDEQRRRHLRYLQDGALEAAYASLANLWSAILATRDTLFFSNGERCDGIVLEGARSIGADAARRGIKARADQLERIVMGSIEPLYEEIMLVLTLRIEMDLMVALGVAAFGWSPDESTPDYDHELESALVARKLQRITREARAAIERNWGVPLASKWLQAVTHALQ
jgi:hypothetical protein